MEFLRFGSSIPGAYWGCCAVCIIQNFKFDPDGKASIQIVNGDGGQAMGDTFAGPTWHDIFKTRIRIGTFSKDEMPNHGFFAVLTDGQIRGSYGSKWLKILREEGFEFIRTVDNSVYTGAHLRADGGKVSSHKNYIFGLFRNIGAGAVDDQFTPPKEWTELNDPYNGDMSQTNRDAVQLELWRKGKTVFLTEAEVVAAGAPVTLGGQRSKFPQQLKAIRESPKAQEAAKAPMKVNAFPTPAPQPVMG